MDKNKVLVCDNGTGVRKLLRSAQSVNGEVVAHTPAHITILAFPLHIPRETDLNLIKQFVKCGFAGSNFPKSIFPSLVGRPILRSEEKVEGIEIKVRFLLRSHRSSEKRLNPRKIQIGCIFWSENQTCTRITRTGGGPILTLQLFTAGCDGWR
jgi:hypothetical protein